jgi:hypothetical protein
VHAACIPSALSGISEDRQVVCWELRRESGYLWNVNDATGRVRIRNDTATCFDLERDCVRIAVQMQDANNQRVIFYDISSPASYQNTEPDPGERFRDATKVLWILGGVLTGHILLYLAFEIGWYRRNNQVPSAL